MEGTYFVVGGGFPWLTHGRTMVLLGVECTTGLLSDTLGATVPCGSEITTHYVTKYFTTGQ